MSAHIRSTVAPSTELVMGVPGAFSEKISNFTLPQQGVYTVTMDMGSYLVQVRGIVMNGVVRIGSAWVVP